MLLLRYAGDRKLAEEVLNGKAVATLGSAATLFMADRAELWVVMDESLVRELMHTSGIYDAKKAALASAITVLGLGELVERSAVVLDDATVEYHEDGSEFIVSYEAPVESWKIPIYFVRLQASLKPLSGKPAGGSGCMLVLMIVVAMGFSALL